MNDDIQEITTSIEELEQIVALGESLKRLEKNRDFQKVFKRHLLEAEPQRLAILRASPSVRNNPKRAEAVLRQIDFVGDFFSFVNDTIVMAETAEQAIISHKKELAMIEAEEDSDE